MNANVTNGETALTWTDASTLKSVLICRGGFTDCRIPPAHMAWLF